MGILSQFGYFKENFSFSSKWKSLFGNNYDYDDKPIPIDTLINNGEVNTNYDAYSDYLTIQKNNFVLSNIFGKISKKVADAFIYDEANKTSELLKKIEKPNNKQTKEEFLCECSTYILSFGYAVIYKRYGSFGNFNTLELININPYYYKIIDKNYVSFQIFEDNLKTNITVPASHVIVMYDSLIDEDTGLGISRIKPLKSQIENLNLSQQAKNIQINNSGTYIISPKQTNNSNIDEGLNSPVPNFGGVKTQKEEMEKNLRQRGLKNRIIVSSKGVDSMNLSEKLNDVDFQKIIEPDILIVYDTFNFPVELTPFGKNATYENKEVAELSLLETGVIPILNKILSNLNIEFSTKGKLSYNYNHLRSMSITKNGIIDTNTKIINQYSLLLEKGIITDKEYKKILIDNNIL